MLDQLFPVLFTSHKHTHTRIHKLTNTTITQSAIAQIPNTHPKSKKKIVLISNVRHQRRLRQLRAMRSEQSSQQSKASGEPEKKYFHYLLCTPRRTVALSTGSTTYYSYPTHSAPRPSLTRSGALNLPSTQTHSHSRNRCSSRIDSTNRKHTQRASERMDENGSASASAKLN